MKLGLGLRASMLTRDEFRFARQAGATHIVVHLNVYQQADRKSVRKAAGGGMILDGRPPWTYEELRDLKSAMNAEGLELAALENFNAAHWHDILLDGPKRSQQIETVKQMIRAMGKAGVPVMGYNFSLSGVWGLTGTLTRGGAKTVEFGKDAQTPMPRGMVWNVIYDPEAPDEPLPTVTHAELWDRLQRFLDDVLPVAEESGVMMALHPDDPPMPTIRGTPRLVYQPKHYSKLLGMHPSAKNGMEFCVGSLTEMNDPDDNDLYAVVDRYAATGRIGYVHFRNVIGKVPHYVETFVDEGDVDMIRVLKILHRHGFDGVLIPDHTPEMSCAAPWHAGMAFALGFMKAAIRCVKEG